MSTSGPRSAFAWAICSSYSKSVAARSPRTMTRAPLLLQKSMSRPSNDSTRHVRQVRRDARARARRALRRRRAASASACRPMATMTSLKSAEARSMRSRWPSVGGIEAPGVDREAGDCRGCSSRLAGGRSAPATPREADGGAAGRGARRCGGPRLRGRERRVGLEPHEAPVVAERHAEEREQVGADDAAEVDVERRSAIVPRSAPSMAGIFARSKPPKLKIGTMPRLTSARPGWR